MNKQNAHCIGYSLLALQEMNLAYKFPIIYWNTACLIVNSGALEEAPPAEEIVSIYEKEDKDADYEDLPDRSGKKKKVASTDYAKLARAIGDTMKLGIKISLVNINESDLGFVPDVKNNQILFGLKGIGHVSDELIENIIKNRPYTSFDDFLARINPNKQAVLMLIKGGAFDCFEDRKELMKRYITMTSDQKKNLTLSNFQALYNNGLVPPELTEEREIFFFNKYIKKGAKVADNYVLDEISQGFYFKTFDDCLTLTSDNKYLLNIKDWEKIYKERMNKVRDWIADNKDELLDKLNGKIFQENWDKYCEKDNISAWEMEAMCFYYHEHELTGVDFARYGITDFTKLSAEPQVDYTFRKEGRDISIYKINKIAGTVIAKDKNKSTLSLLTTSGVVTVKFRKEQFAIYDKQISEIQPDKTKKVIEKSWFNRGNILIIQGIRRDDDFMAKKYSKTPGHTVYKINEILENKDLVLQDQRAQGD